MSQRKAREFSAEFKLAAVQRAQAGERIATIADEFGIRRKLIYAWKDRYAELGEAGLSNKSGRPRKDAARPSPDPQPGRGELLAARKRIADLERKVGQQELELDFFEEALRRVAAVRKPANGKRSADTSRNEPGKAN